MPATKYICGHSDTMMGVASTGEALYQQLRHGMQDLGAFISPDDCYQALQGLRTLSVRLERHQANALRLATWLQTRPEVERVLYPALPDDPGHALWRRDFRGASGLFGDSAQALSEARPGTPWWTASSCSAWARPGAATRA